MSSAMVCNVTTLYLLSEWGEGETMINKGITQRGEDSYSSNSSNRKGPIVDLSFTHIKNIYGLYSLKGQFCDGLVFLFINSRM